MDERLDRLDLSDLTLEQIAQLEAHFTPAWPDTWRDFARSCYATLLSLPGAAPLADCAQCAVHLTLGLAQDLGGTQPYIAVGTAMAASAKARRVAAMLQAGRPYAEVARATGLTLSRVRQIEAAWRREQAARSQPSLPLE